MQIFDLSSHVQNTISTFFCCYISSQHQLTTLHDIGDSTLHTNSGSPSPFVDARAPAHLCKLHASTVDSYAAATHVHRAPLVHTHVMLDFTACEMHSVH